MATLGDLLAQVEDLDAQIEAVDNAELVVGREAEGIVQYVDPATGESVELSREELQIFRNTLTGAKRQASKILRPYSSAKKAYDAAQAELRRAEEVARNPITEAPGGMSQAEADKNVVTARKKVEAAGRKVNLSVRRVEATETPEEVVQAETGGPTRREGAVGRTGAARPAGGSTAGQFRMAEAAAGEPTAATMADVKTRVAKIRAAKPKTGGAVPAGAGVDSAIPPSVADGGKGGKGGGKPRGNWEAIIRREFGAYAAYIGIDPTVDDALGKLARGDISEDRFDAMVRSSEWWKNTNDFIRQWDLKERTPGSTAGKEVADRVQEMQDYALGEFGVSLSPEALRAWARQSLRERSSALTWQNGVGAIIEKGTSPGAVDQLRTGNVGEKLRRINAQYGYDVSSDYFNKSVANIANGTLTEEMYENEVKTQAKTLYGQDVGQLLDQGYTLEDIASPYLQVAANTLEVPVDSMMLSDPKFKAALDFTDEKGQRRRMSLNEWQRKLRSDPQYGWDKTEQARQSADRAASTILRAFGKVS